MHSPRDTGAPDSRHTASRLVDDRSQYDASMQSHTDVTCVAEVLRQALDAVDRAELPDNLREVGFRAAVDLIAPRPNAARTTWQLVPPAEGVDSETEADLQPSGGERLMRIGSPLGIQAEHVGRLFDDHDGTLQFCGDVARLGKSKAAKVQGLAVLLIAARQAGGYDEERTDDAAIRTEVDRHGLLDTTNYNKHLKDLRKYANVNGSGRKANFKLKYEGGIEAKRIASELLAE